MSFTSLVEGCTSWSIIHSSKHAPAHDDKVVNHANQGYNRLIYSISTGINGGIGLRWALLRQDDHIGGAGTNLVWILPSDTSHEDIYLKVNYENFDTTSLMSSAGARCAHQWIFACVLTCWLNVDPMINQGHRLLLSNRWPILTINFCHYFPSILNWLNL